MKFVELENLHLCNWEDPSPTHIDRSGGQNNILDLVITNASEKITEFKVDKELKFSPYRVRKVKTGLQKKYTDHLSLITTLKTSRIKNLTSTKHVSWNYFKAGGDDRYKEETDVLALEINDLETDENTLKSQLDQRNIEIEKLKAELNSAFGKNLYNYS